MSDDSDPIGYGCNIGYGVIMAAVGLAAAILSFITALRIVNWAWETAFGGPLF